MVRAGDYNFFYGKGNENNQLGTEIFVQHRIVSAVKKLEFVSHTMSYFWEVAGFYHFSECVCTKGGEMWWFENFMGN